MNQISCRTNATLLEIFCLLFLNYVNKNRKDMATSPVVMETKKALPVLHVDEITFDGTILYASPKWYV